MFSPGDLPLIRDHCSSCLNDTTQDLLIGAVALCRSGDSIARNHNLLIRVATVRWVAIMRQGLALFHTADAGRLNRRRVP